MNIQILRTDTALQRKLLGQIRTRRSKLKRNQRYQLESILGDDYWKAMSDPPTTVGRCFSDLVSKNRVPFFHKGFTTDRHNRYQYTG